MGAAPGAGTARPRPIGPRAPPRPRPLKGPPLAPPSSRRAAPSVPRSVRPSVRPSDEEARPPALHRRHLLHRDGRRRRRRRRWVSAGPRGTGWRGGGAQRGFARSRFLSQQQLQGRFADPSPLWDPFVGRWHRRGAPGGRAGPWAEAEAAGAVQPPLLGGRRRGRLRVRHGPARAAGGMRVQRDGENLLHHSRLDGEYGGCCAARGDAPCTIRPLRDVKLSCKWSVSPE